MLDEWKSLHPLETGPQMFERGDVLVSISYEGNLEVEIDDRRHGSVRAYIPRTIIDQLFEAYAKMKEGA